MAKFHSFPERTLLLHNNYYYYSPVTLHYSPAATILNEDPVSIQDIEGKHTDSRHIQVTCTGTFK